MNKLLIAAAALAAVLPLAGQAQAAPAKDPMCSLAPATYSASWAEYYGCWGAAPRNQYQPAATPAAYTGPSDGDFCKLPAASAPSWAEHYGCWRPHR
jgi:hypothetical protein